MFSHISALPIQGATHVWLISKFSLKGEAQIGAGTAFTRSIATSKKRFLQTSLHDRCGVEAMLGGSIAIVKPISANVKHRE